MRRVYFSFLLAMLATAPLEPAGAADRPPGPRTEQARTVSDFIDSLGVGVHGIGNDRQMYTSDSRLVSALSFLGFRHARATPQTEARARALTGIGVDFTHVATTDLAGTLAALKRFSRQIVAVEGLNEVDEHDVNFQGLKGIEAGVAYQKLLYAAVKGDPALAHINVYNVTIGRASRTPKAGDLSPYTDFSNIHAYIQNGGPPFLSVPQAIAQTVDAPGRPIIISETGAPTNDPRFPPLIYLGGNPKHPSNMVSEDVQQKLVLCVVLDSFKMGIVRSFLYELYDQAKLDSNRNPIIDENADRENHFGMFRFDLKTLTPKPIAVAFHNLTSILKAAAPQTPPFSPGSLSFSLNSSRRAPGVDPEAFHVLLQKDARTFDLIVWAEPKIWDMPTASEIETIPSEVTVDLAQQAARVSVFDPVIGQQPIANLKDTRKIQVKVTDHPVIIEISN